MGEILLEVSGTPPKYLKTLGEGILVDQGPNKFLGLRCFVVLPIEKEKGSDGNQNDKLSKEDANSRWKVQICTVFSFVVIKIHFLIFFQVRIMLVLTIEGRVKFHERERGRSGPGVSKWGQGRYSYLGYFREKEWKERDERVDDGQRPPSFPPFSFFKSINELIKATLHR